MEREYTDLSMLEALSAISPWKEITFFIQSKVNPQVNPLYHLNSKQLAENPDLSQGYRAHP